jgi:hypothetical protein
MGRSSVTNFGFGFAVAILAGLLCGPAAAQTHRITASAANCQPPTPQQTAWIPAEWARFSPYVRVCAVRDSKRRTVINLISVWAQLYYRDQHEPVVEQVQMPHPLILSATGEPLGSLPANFPDDPPAELRVTFAHWQHDFPQRIELFLTDPRAGGPRALRALHWDSSAKRYHSKSDTPP